MDAVRALALGFALTLLAAAPAPGHPGHGPGTVDIGDFAFKPATLKVAEGDTVIWFWTGPDTNHSVTAEQGQGESFDSDRGTLPALVSHERNDAYSYEFDEIGTYSYFCKVHPDSMRGTIEVIKAPRRDVKPPKLRQLRVRGNRVRFKVSEAAFVVTSIRNRENGKVVRRAARFVKRGRRGVSFRRRGLAVGRYKAKLVAEDNAGNSSRWSVRFRIR